MEYNETLELIIKQLELQPLKPNSVYRVKFYKDASIQDVGRIIKILNEQCKHQNITFIPSCDYFEIVEESK